MQESTVIPTERDAPTGLAKNEGLRYLGRQDWLILGGAFAIAFLLRLFFVTRMGTIDSEGAEYARIAENLLAGNGYTGLVTPGKNLIFPPLYPDVVALVSLALGNVELAARLVSTLMGSLLVVPVYLIARRFFGARLAPFSALMVALQPMLIGFAASVYCETTYITLQLVATYLCLRAFSEDTALFSVLAGVALGAAYLVRPEAALYAVLAAALVFAMGVVRQEKMLVTARNSILLFGAFAILALPYIVWLHSQTGHWRLEGKSSLNYATQLLMDQGDDMYAASYKVSPDLSEGGIWMKSHAATMAQIEMTPRKTVEYVTGHAKPVINFLRTSLTSEGVIGAPLIIGLCLLGLFCKPWSRDQLVANFFIFCMLAATGAALVFIYYKSPRYLITFVPFLCIWAAGGIGVLSSWLRDTLRLVIRKPEIAISESWVGVVFSLAVALSAVPAAMNLYELKTFAAVNRPIREAGEWLNHYAPGDKVVSDSQHLLPFHAHARFVPIPYADSDTAVRYLKKRGVRFVAVYESDQTSTPYMADWFKNGAPGATLVYDHIAPKLGRIAIYEWK